jgi:acylphosphatase
MKKAVRVHFKGTVQGIFFRQFMKEHADKRSVRGFARNLEDGRVEAWFEGDSAMVDEMVEVCRIGPRHSQIKTVDVKEEKLQDFREFKILKF